MKKLFRIILLLVLLLCSSIGVNGLVVSASSNEQVIYNILRNTYGFNKAQACGILANIRAESSFNPNIYNKSKISYGLMQWTGPRKTSLFNYCKSRGLNSASISAQLSFMNYEFKTTEKTSYKLIVSQPNNSVGAYNAAYYMCTKFERPAGGTVSAAKRATEAQKVFYPKYAGSSIVSTSTYKSTVSSSSTKKVSVSTTTYKVNSSVNYRKGPSTKYASYGRIPAGTKLAVSSISNGWAKTTYKNKTVYVSTRYLTKVTTSTSKTGNYKITIKLRFRSGPSTSTKSYGYIPKGTVVKVTSITNGWGKITYKGKTGYILLKYASKC